MRNLDEIQKSMDIRNKKRNNAAKLKVQIHIMKGLSTGCMPGTGKESILKRTRKYSMIGKIKGSV